MAAERAKIMQRMTSRNNVIISFQNVKGITIVCHPGPTEMGILETAKKNPINAKGIAKMVCENLMSDK
jgi:hypothetical protein